MLLQDFIDEIKSQMRDGANIIAPDRIPTLLRKALEGYSKKKPRDVVVDVESDGSGDFLISDLTGFDQNISGDVTVEYPISSAGEDPTYLDRRDWKFYDTPAGRVVRTAAGAPAGALVRFAFKGIHSVTDSASTVPDSDFYAVSKLGAAEGLSEVATHYAQSAENSFVNADVANYQSKADTYQKRSAQLRKEANEHIGAGSDEMGTPAASVNTNWDTRGTGGDWLTHPRRRR